MDKDAVIAGLRPMNGCNEMDTAVEFIEQQDAEIARLTAERDTALAQVAAVIEDTKTALAMGDAGYRVHHNPDARAALSRLLDEAYAAGQERMRDRAARALTRADDRYFIRTLPITPRPDRENRT